MKTTFSGRLERRKLAAIGFFAFLNGVFSGAVRARADAGDCVLHSCIAAPYRPEEHVITDIWHQPYESLKFWGLKPSMKVLDLQPGSGYWTYILAPYLRRTDGVYVAAIPVTNPPEKGIRAMVDFAHEFSDHARFGTVIVTDFDPGKMPISPPHSIDIVISAGEVHSWIRYGYIDNVMRQVAEVLKRGGVFAVEDHRADSRAQKSASSDGYAAVAIVVSAAAKAGLALEARSKINANAKDTKDYSQGMWSLRPTRKHDAVSLLHPAPYDDIGESNRMTFRFRKV